MKQTILRKKPDLRLLLGASIALQVVVVCLMMIFEYIGMAYGWGGTARTSQDPASLAVLAIVLFSLVVSVIVRYLALYLSSWSLARNPKICQRSFLYGLAINVIFDIFQAFILILTLAIPQVDGGFALLIIPLGGFWVCLGSVTVSIGLRLLGRKHQ